MPFRARRSKSDRVAIGLVAAAGALNVVLLGRLIVGLPAEPSNDPTMVTGTIFLVVVTMLPVAAMLYVALRPLPPVASRRSLLVGSVAFFALNLILTGSALTSDSSTSALGFLISVPVLLTVVGVTWVNVFPGGSAPDRFGPG